MGERKEQQFPPQETVEESQEYNPIVSVRRDFGPEGIYEGEDGKMEMDSAFHRILDYYRASIKEGSLLNVGAGPTHPHYLAAIEDKLSHIAALDISQKNLRAVEEFLDVVSGRKKPEECEYVSAEDMEILRRTAQAYANAGKYGEADAQSRLTGIVEKSKLPEGQYDLIIDDMYQLRNLGERKFDNILIGFALYAPRDVDPQESLRSLMSKLRDHLNPGGHLVICDLLNFTDEDAQGEFNEDTLVKKGFTANVTLTNGVLARTLNEVGFSEVKAREDKEPPPGEEWRYVYAQAVNSEITRT